MAIIDQGKLLEARFLRLFLARGVFAEQGLHPKAGDGYDLLVTDIDVLVTEYSIGFHRTRRHAECKSGKVSNLDRILWLCGVRHLLNADGSFYVVGQGVRPEVSDFARTLNVDVYGPARLEAMEKAAGIQSLIWPCRSDLYTLEPAHEAWRKKTSAHHQNDKRWKTLKEMKFFITHDSWLQFAWGHLNKLLRLLSDAAEIIRTSNCPDQVLFARYLAAALAVRFTEYVMEICFITLHIANTDFAAHIYDKLIFAGGNPSQIRGLMSSLEKWMIGAAGVERDKISLGSAPFFSPPDGANEFVALLEAYRAAPEEARFSVVAMERRLFGDKWEDNFMALDLAGRQAGNLPDLTLGYLQRRSPGTSWLKPVMCDLAKKYGPEAVQDSKRPARVKGKPEEQGLHDIPEKVETEPPRGTE